MGLLDKMFGKAGAKDISNQLSGTKKERMRREYDERIAKDPNIDRSYLLHSLQTKYEQEPEFIPKKERTPQHQMRPKYQQERPPQRKERTFWDKLVDASSNVHANIERESFGMGQGIDFGGGGFGGVDLMEASGFGASRQERKYHSKKHKKQKQQKQGKQGRSITINL